ncbi:MAG: TolC family protein [Gemmatimonadetes bacterium]|nr:TolC family protein [Gemmatimonadota bacterium]
MNQPSHSTVTLLFLAAAVTLTAPQALQGQSLTLAAAAESALGSHPTVQSAAAHVNAADETLAAARAARIPSLGATVNLTRFQEPMVVAPFHSFDPVNPPGFDRTLLQGQVGVAYTVFDAGARSARIEGAGAIAEATRLGSEATEMVLIEQVASTYVGVLSARAVLDAATRLVAAVDAEGARAQRHFDAGTAAEVAVLRASAALQDARAQLATAEARVGLAERSLARVMGVPADVVTGRDLADVAVTGADAAISIAGSPILRQAGRVVEASEAVLAEQRAGRLPKLDMKAGIADFATLTGDHVTEWQAGLQMTLPFFTGGTRRAAIRRAQAGVVAARSDMAATELALLSAVDVAETAVTETQGRALALEAAVAQWTEVARIEALALDAGSGLQSDLLRAQAGLYQSPSGHARARYDNVLARVSMARTRGTLDMNWLNEVLEIRP